MTHARGLHEIRGLRSLRALGSAAERGKLTAKLSRLDHQHGLLERQLAVWDEKQRVTKHRITLLDEEITELGRMIREFGGAYRNVDQRKRTRPVKSPAPPRGYPAARRSVVNLDY